MCERYRPIMAQATVRSTASYRRIAMILTSSPQELDFGWHGLWHSSVSRSQARGAQEGSREHDRHQLTYHSRAEYRPRGSKTKFEGRANRAGCAGGRERGAPRPGHACWPSTTPLSFRQRCRRSGEGRSPPWIRLYRPDRCGSEQAQPRHQRPAPRGRRTAAPYPRCGGE